MYAILGHVLFKEERVSTQTLMFEHDSTRSRDRLLNFNVILPLIVVKMISQDCCHPPFVPVYLPYVCILSKHYFTNLQGLLFNKFTLPHKIQLPVAEKIHLMKVT